jgi:hypothetical protein
MRHCVLLDSPYLERNDIMDTVARKCLAGAWHWLTRRAQAAVGTQLDDPVGLVQGMTDLHASTTFSEAAITLNDQAPGVVRQSLAATIAHHGDSPGSAMADQENWAPGRPQTPAAWRLRHIQL